MSANPRTGDNTYGETTFAGYGDSALYVRKS